MLGLNHASDFNTCTVRVLLRLMRSKFLVVHVSMEALFEKYNFICSNSRSGLWNLSCTNVPTFYWCQIFIHKWMLKLICKSTFREWEQVHWILYEWDMTPHIGLTLQKPGGIMVSWRSDVLSSRSPQFCLQAFDVYSERWWRLQLEKTWTFQFN